MDRAAFDQEAIVVACTRCEWQGPARDLVAYKFITDRYCPRCMAAFVRYPLRPTNAQLAAKRTV